MLFKLVLMYWRSYSDVHGINNYSQLLIAKAEVVSITGYYGILKGEEIGKVDHGGIGK